MEVTDPRGSGRCCCLLCGAAPTASLGVPNRGSLWRRRFGFVCGCWDSGRWLAARTPVLWPRCAGAAAAGDSVPRTCAALRRGWRCCSLSKGLFPALSQGAAGHKDKRGLAAVRGRLCSEQPVRAPAGCGGFIKRKLFCSRVGPGCFGAAPQAPRRCEERGAPGGRCLRAASRGRCGWPYPALPRDSFLPGAPRFCGKCWPRAGCRSCRSEKVPRTTRLCPSPPAAQTARCDVAHSVAGESTPPPSSQGRDLQRKYWQI